MNERRRAATPDLLVLLATAALVFVLDQVTKALVVSSIGVGQRVPVIGDVVQLWHAQNAGAAFSLFQGEQLLFFIVTLVALGMIGYFHRAFLGRGAWVQAILGLALGGTLGNFTDRLRLGYVVDFLSVGIGSTRWPTFNVADAAIDIGIGLLVLYLVFFDRGRQDVPA